MEYKYPNDGKIRPPQNPIGRPLYDYFAIPGKPYFVNDELNYELLNKDIIEYGKMSLERIPGVSISPIYVKWLEICWGYNLTQETVDNLEFHRKRTNSDVSMEYLVSFVKKYYKDDLWCNRKVYSIWFTPQELAFYKGKDIYDNRIYTEIYTKSWTRSVHFE